ncbi:MAG TPA: GH3 auxin-responsive promoter family protein [Pyrinomonadaceae bacterium]|nr:GH3 auxin-responsive promoter family protein [Pyrinomonadaceae bacterium]
MRGVINDFLRGLIAAAIRSLGLLLTILQTVRMKNFFRNQKRLARRYEINSDTPILTFGPELEGSIERAAAKAGQGSRFAWTSGSTAKPKGILYTKRRLRGVKLAYVNFFARCSWSLKHKRTSLYLFSALSKDDSLTTMLLEEPGLPPYLASLQAPYRVHRHPAIQSLASEYGATAVRLWILAISNPGILYSTNPSTLSTFLDELTTDWPRSAQLICNWWSKPAVFDPGVHKIAKHLKSRGSDARLKRIAASDSPLPLQVCAPAVHAYLCWTGGYVKPFLDRLAKYLPADRYNLIPLYSMSTETLETEGHFVDNKPAFLPLAQHVLYEFIEEGAADNPQNLLTADQLCTGKTYAMVVSDAYGLRRYQTGDVFLCRRFVAGLPDLSFLRRRDLEYSFTGEKITSEQLIAVFQKLRSEYPQLGSERFLTCVPSLPDGETRPHYKIVLVKSDVKDLGLPVDELATRCNQLLSEMNREYESKYQSGRLGPAKFILISQRDLIERLAGAAKSKTWESQFKFLPLYRNTWENLKT